MTNNENYTVQDLQDNLDYLAQTKVLIKNAIVNKGQTIDENTPFRQYAQKISNIQTGTDTSDATAVANDILEGKTAYVDGQKIIGTYVPLDTFDATATASDILKDKTAYVNGEKITGTFESSGGDEDFNILSKGVDFIDYDGKLLYSYTIEEIQRLEALPQLPKHKGLICQEWNWTLDDIKELNQPLCIGANYITDDGKTRLYISIESNSKKDISLYFTQSISNGVEIDWGDNSTVETASDVGNVLLTHNYQTIGNYIITLNPINDCEISLGNSTNSVFGGTSALNSVYSSYRNMIKKIELGKNINSINKNAFNGLLSLRSISIPSTIINFNSYAFNNCMSLYSIVLSKNTEIVDSNCFYSCTSLKYASLPKAVNTMNTYIFYDCNSLSKIYIPKNALTIYNNCFSGCDSLSCVVIANDVTDIKQNAFYNCYSINEILIPPSVINLGNASFQGLQGISKYDFSYHRQIPTIGTNVFAQNYTNRKIVVPDDLYDDWIITKNWSNYASYIIKASEYNQ